MLGTSLMGSMCCVISLIVTIRSVVVLLLFFFFFFFPLGPDFKMVVYVDPPNARKPKALPETTITHWFLQVPPKIESVGAYKQ